MVVTDMVRDYFCGFTFTSMYSIHVISMRSENSATHCVVRTNTDSDETLSYIQRASFIATVS